MKKQTSHSMPIPGSSSAASHSVSHGELPYYIGYLRVSKERDTTGSHTFETQEARIREYLERRHSIGGYKVDFFKDDGFSGGLGLRPTGIEPRVRRTLQTIANIIWSGPCAGLVIYGQSRFFRNVRGLAEMIEDVLLPTGTPLLSPTEDIDISSPDGRMVVLMKGIFDQKVREDIIKRNKDAANTRREAGFWLGQVPYGWKWDEQHQFGQRRGIVPVPEEKQWVLYIKERYLAGWNSYRIADELNQQQVPSPVTRQACGKKAANIRERRGHEPRWTNAVVWRILQSPAHAGQVRTGKDELVQGQHWEQRFWEPEEREQIMHSHDGRIARFKGPTGQRNTPHLLSGLIRCARCGKRLYMGSTSATTKAHRSYMCSTRLQDKNSPCKQVVARAQWVEEAVVEELGRIAKEPALRQMLLEEVAQATGRQDDELKQEQKRLRRSLEQFEAQVEKWAEAYTKGILAEAQFVKFNQKLQKKQQEAQQQLAQVEQQLENRQGRQQACEQLHEKLLDFPLIWENLDNDERRTLLTLLLEEDSLIVDRVGLDILLKLKIHLLPPVERHIEYQSKRGQRHTFGTGLQRLTQRQMVLLYHAAQGKSHRECAQLMGCKVTSVYSMVNIILRNLNVSTWAEAVEMTREQVTAYKDQLPFDSNGRMRSVGNQAGGEVTPFLSPVLMEVFALFAQGATVPEVAEKLHLPVSTVQGRRQRILKHFGTNSIFEAVQKAKGQRLLPAC